MSQEQIQNLIKELMIKVSATDDIVVNECILDDKLGGRCFSVEIKNAHPFLNREGEGLQAINHIIRRILESKTNTTEENKEPGFIVDINGFQKKRLENLKSLVHMMAERARYFKSSVELDPMSAYDRRIVHECLSDASDLKTESDGFGRNRHVVIRYTGQI